MEIEIVTFVVTGSAKLTVPTDWQEQIQVGSRSVALNLYLQIIQSQTCYPLNIRNIILILF